MQSLKLSKVKIITSILIGGLCSGVLMVTSQANLSDTNTRCLWILGTLYLMLFNYLVFWGYAIKYATGRRVPVKTAFSVALAIFWFVTLPFGYDKVVGNNFFLAHYLENQHISIQPTTNVSGTESGNEIWLEGIKVDGEDYNMYEIPLAGGWEFVEDRPYTNQEDAEPLTFELAAEKSYEVMIRRGPNAGTARISIGDKSETFSFFGDEYEQHEVVDIKKVFAKYSPKGNMLEKLLYSSMCFFVLFELSFTMMSWLFVFAYREKKLKEKELKKDDRKSA